MNSPKSSGGSSNEEEDILLAMQLCGLGLVPYAINTAKELCLFEIIAKARGTHISPLCLASIAAPENPDAPMMIDRLLRFLVAYSVFTYKLVKSEEGRECRAYGLGKVGKTFTKDEDGFSMLPYVFDGNGTNLWSYFTKSILEGGPTPWERARGALVFDHVKENEDSRKGFYELLTNHTSIEMKKILDNYNGFESMCGRTLVDVGGCLGSSLAQILSKFPLIKGVNFDLPHIVQEAPKIEGVEHIGGDMFDEIPRGDAIMLKLILHDWNDEICTEILTKCKEALSETGKIIVIERILPWEVEDTDLAAKISLCSDVMMMGLTRGGKERTKEEFEDLALKAGFKIPNIIYGAYAFWILELYPN